MLLLQSRKKSRLRQRLTILALLALTIPGYFGWRYAKAELLPRYRAWKQAKALDRAKEFIAKKDPASAKLEIEIALTAVPGSPEAIRVAGDLLELVGSPQALTLRRAMVNLAPDSVADRVAMVSTALRLRDFNSARDALTGFTTAQVEQPAVLRAHLAYALATNNRPIADALFDRLAAIATPDDEMKALHAMLLRQHPDAQKSAAAKKELETLAQNPRFALTLNRAFFNEAVAAKDLPAAKRFAALASADPAATFTDRLNEANFTLLLDKQPFETVFASLTPTAAASGLAAAEFSRWLVVQGKAAEAERWLAGLPPAIISAPEVASARLELAAVAKDWDRFGQLLGSGAWGPIAPEVARLVMSAHVVGERNAALQKQIWDEAIASAHGNLVTYRVLLRVANAWQWSDETESVLWAVVRADAEQTWAHSALINVFRQRGDGRKMLDVITILKNAAPSSTTYRHDWALLTLLVSPTSEWDNPKAVAKDVYLGDPANPSYAATYALALTEAGKAEDARAVLEKLSVGDREFPLRAPYLAFVYGHCRRQAEFEKYAALVGSAPVLHEERLLIERGREAVTRVAPRKEPEPKSPATTKAKPKS